MIELEKYKSGTYEKAYQYEYFVPTKINDKWSWQNQNINTLLEKAAIKLGELNSYAKLVPNIDLFIRLHVTKEAVTSSKIEGTQTKIDEALLPVEEIGFEKRDDWQEVKNYVNALNEAIKSLETLPISSRLLRQTHKALLKSVRGEHKLPGEYRKSQNWIGGASLQDATFIPPSHILVDEYMNDLENFLHNENLNLPDLIKIAIIHYQFETIHPFLDGNGRIGRLLIILFLIEKKILDKPLLYLSLYFEKNRRLYYENLENVRTKNDMTQWIKYFLVGIEQISTKAIGILSNIIDMKNEMEKEINENFGRRSNNGINLLQSLFNEPIINVENVKIICNLSYKSANDLISLMQKNGYLTEITGQNRNRFFIFKRYLDIFK